MGWVLTAPPIRPITPAAKITFCTGNRREYETRVASVAVSTSTASGHPGLPGNRSGTSDILWRNESTGQIYVLLMAGPTALAEGPIYNEPNLQWKPVAFGDYNGDGLSDVLLRNDTTGQVYMLVMNGLQVFAQAMVYQEANTNWKIMGPLEYGTANGIFP